MPSMYEEHALWFHFLTPPSEYAAEAEFYARTLERFAEVPPETVLELGSGGGNNASHLKKRYRLTLSDLSPQMLALSETINPECEHVVGDMRSLRLDREFDAVFVHDAIVYMTSEADLLASIETAYVHCRPGGVALFAPDDVRETLSARTDHGGSDAGDGRGMRYLEWVWDPDPDDDTYLVDYAFLLRNADGSVTVAHDRHTCGIYARAVWMRLLSDAGFRAERVEGLAGETGPDIFVGVKTAT